MKTDFNNKSFQEHLPEEHLSEEHSLNEGSSKEVLTEENAFERYLSSAINMESSPVSDSGRVDNIMDKVFELRLEASYETRVVNLKTALLYGLSVAASISVGCIIGNLYEISKIYSSTATAGMDFITLGFGSIFLSI